MSEPFNANTDSRKQTGAVIPDEDWFKVVVKQVKSVKYGSVQIVIQDGKVVQIESTEKIRLDQPQAKGGSGKKWTPST
jgi:hypothetical protein